MEEYVQTSLYDGGPAMVRDAATPTVSGDDTTGATQGEGGQFCDNAEKAPANTRVYLVGGDTCRGRAERMSPVQTSSPLRDKSEQD